MTMKVREEEHFYVIHKSSGQSIVLNWNPSQFKRVFKVNWSRHQVPGLSHQRSQYINTQNVPVEFDIVIDGLDVGGPVEVEKHRRFLESLCYPRSAKRIEGAGPSPVIIGQPNFLRVVGVIDEITFEETHFYRNGACRRFKATVKFVEEPSRRRTAKQVRDRRLNPKRVYSGSIARDQVGF